MKEKKQKDQITVAEAGRRGGLARAAKHSKKQLSAWAKKGGRPFKQKEGKGRTPPTAKQGTKRTRKS